jgi:hypothetical protein
MTPTPTTAAVSATGIQVDAVLRRISVISSPTLHLAARKQPGPKVELIACANCQLREGSESRTRYMRFVGGAESE